MGVQGASHRNLGTEKVARITTLSLRRAQICIQQQSFEKRRVKILFRPLEALLACSPNKYCKPDSTALLKFWDRRALGIVCL